MGDKTVNIVNFVNVIEPPYSLSIVPGLRSRAHPSALAAKRVRSM